MFLFSLILTSQDASSYLNILSNPKFPILGKIPIIKATSGNSPTRVWPGRGTLLTHCTYPMHGVFLSCVNGLIIFERINSRDRQNWGEGGGGQNFCQM